MRADLNNAHEANPKQALIRKPGTEKQAQTPIKKTKKKGAQTENMTHRHT